MCGICGIVFFQEARPVDRSRLKLMTESLAHRGPDDQGIWIKGHVGLGHRRLSIIDLTAAGRQPLSNENEEIWITYNGEVYNFQELRIELEARGHRFKSRTDTEVIIHLYEEEGYRCLNRLRGMFAFAIWDNKNKTLFAARDRMGQKPFYYYLDDEKFIFASEIKSILSSGLVEKEIDYEAIYQYLHLGYVPHPKTGFKGIKKLPPGHRLTLNETNVTIESYWSLNEDFEQGEILDEREASQRLIDLLMEAIRIRMVSDVPLGVLLSGGIDSNAVVALMSRYPGKIKTFTIGFEDKLYDERNEAGFLAERLGTDHHEMVVRPDVADLLPKLVRAYDEPFADPSAIPSYYVAQMARQSVTVVLNGDGGDENFAGYGEYIQGRLGKWVGKIPKQLGGVFSRVLERKEPCKAKSLSQVLALCGRSPAEIFSHLKLMLPRTHLDELLSPDYKALVGWFDPINHLVNCYGNFDRRDTINTMLAVDRQTYLPDDLLFKIDIASMSHGLEARSPFLDHHLVEFAAGLPGSYKLRGLKKKYILKEALKDILPEQVLKRSKRGFDVPVSGWLRGELEELCREALTSKGLVADLFNKIQLAKMFEQHVAGREEWGRFFWMILMLHLWSETFLKGETGA